MHLVRIAVSLPARRRRARGAGSSRPVADERRTSAARVTTSLTGRLDDPRRHRGERDVRPRRALAAEAAADEVVDHAHVLLVEPEERREPLAHAEDALRRVVERQVSRSPCHTAIVACGSIGLWFSTASCTSRRRLSVAAASPAATSPRVVSVAPRGPACSGLYAVARGASMSAAAALASYVALTQRRRVLRVLERVGDDDARSAGRRSGRRRPAGAAGPGPAACSARSRRASFGALLVREDREHAGRRCAPRACRSPLTRAAARSRSPTITACATLATGLGRVLAPPVTLSRPSTRSMRLADCGHASCGTSHGQLERAHERPLRELDLERVVAAAASRPRARPSAALRNTLGSTACRRPAPLGLARAPRLGRRRRRARRARRGSCRRRGRAPTAAEASANANAARSRTFR